jgi:hypothetical protein
MATEAFVLTSTSGASAATPILRLAATAWTRDGNCHNFSSFRAAFRAAHALAYGLECCRRSAEARECFRLCYSMSPALACDPHQEMAQGIVQALDVGQQTHAGNRATGVERASIQRPKLAVTGWVFGLLMARSLESLGSQPLTMAGEADERRAARPLIPTASYRGGRHTN